MAAAVEPELTSTHAQRERSRRLFLRAMLLSEHLVLLAVGSYSLWTQEEWQALIFGRVGATLLLAIGVAISYLIALVLAAVTLRWRSGIWIATLAGGGVGPLVAAGALFAALQFL